VGLGAACQYLFVQPLRHLSKVEPSGIGNDSVRDSAADLAYKMLFDLGRRDLHLLDTLFALVLSKEVGNSPAAVNNLFSTQPHAVVWGRKAGDARSCNQASIVHGPYHGKWPV